MLGFDSIAKRQVKLAIQCPSVLLLLLEALNASSSDFPFGHIIQGECSLADRCEKKEMLIIMFCGRPVAAPAGQMK